MWWLRSHAGKGALGIVLMTVVIAVPPSINFLAGALLLAWAVDHLKAAFRALEREEAEAMEREATALLPVIETNGRAVYALAERGEN